MSVCDMQICVYGRVVCGVGGWGACSVLVLFIRLKFIQYCTFYQNAKRTESTCSYTLYSAVDRRWTI